MPDLGVQLLQGRVRRCEPQAAAGEAEQLPPGFFSNLLLDNGLSVNSGNGHYSQPLSNGVHAIPRTTRLKSQLSFSGQEALPQISEIGVTDMGESVIGSNRSDETGGNVGQSYSSTNFQISSWDDTNSIAFSAPSSKRARDCNEDLLNSFSNIGFEFGLTSLLDMEAQQDSVAFKVRAKRGCATHPRSIAERERRTRISDKLRKLQELVPNMDKQTSTADMLDLAVDQIKSCKAKCRILNKNKQIVHAHARKKFHERKRNHCWCIEKYLAVLLVGHGQDIFCSSAGRFEFLSSYNKEQVLFVFKN
ncbi:transcription factor bHLH128-like isoform X2 [Iris pallida]|uniref:Transcription factor bHLH128-like isoform X2 n=1 Tax=Iris pallida TaxID=29817 RepID=A0AAX6DK35_IRIPA|nr:transcription factor bHLH128-like isoform X2 [Iris pallida]